LGFGKNQFRVLVTKPKIASFGLNYQNCHNMVFASPDYSYEKMYQAIRRELRYGQTRDVNVWLITTDTMQNVIQSLKIKERQDQEMKHWAIKHNKQLYGNYRIAA
jgi:SNF2 family DNA or RNA helicase